jgi:hypothetical protein
VVNKNNLVAASLAGLALVPGVNAGFALGAAAIGAIGQVVGAIQNTSKNDQLGRLTISNRLATLENLYCALESNNQITAQTISAWHNANDADSISSATILRRYTEVIGLSNLQVRATVGGLSQSQECNSYDCGWCYVADFTTGQQGWDVVSGRGFYTAGTGFTSIYNVSGLNNTEIRISRTVSSTTFNRVDILYTANTNIQFLDSYNFAFTDSAPAGTDAIFTKTATLTANVLRFDFARVASGPGLSITIKRMTFRGSGANPFGSSNCP